MVRWSVIFTPLIMYYIMMKTKIFRLSDIKEIIYPIGQARYLIGASTIKKGKRHITAVMSGAKRRFDSGDT